MSRNILFIDRAHPVLPSRLEELGYTCDFHFDTPRAELERILPDYFGIVMRSRISIDKEFIDKKGKLHFIAREGVGVEHIDVDYAESQGVKIITSPEGSRDTVGEHAIGMLLNLLNNLNRADRQVRQGQWQREMNRAIELKGKTIGIIGYGNMGSSFARKVSGFEAKVLAYDKFKTGYGDTFAQEVDLETIFAESDIITLHIPFSAENHYFVNDAFINSFKKDIFIINTARGLVLNTADLVKNLKSGKVRGAALDVLEYEETSFEGMKSETLPEPFHYLTQADNVILAPHIAGWSFESKEGHGIVLAGKIEQFFGRGG